jgi:high-affinity iron transporter
VLGLLAAIIIGYGLYRGARVINLRTFFRWTGAALIFVAAGLLSLAVHEFVEVGWITVGTSTAFDISGILPHSGDGPSAALGQLLRAIFGYSSTPEWITLLVWLAYLGAVLTLYLRPMKPKPARPVPDSQPVVGG